MFFERKVAIFYEKPGCTGNKKQKELLWSHGITLVVKSILDSSWSKEQLQAFFTGLDNDKIVNPFAPQIKKGDIDVSKLSQEELIDLMIQEPILIKRPLVEVNESKVCGFNKEKLSQLLNIEFENSFVEGNCQSSMKCS